MNTNVIGIDLGTTYSAVARLDEHGKPVTLVNAEGDLVTPSIVLFDGDDVIVGKEAHKAMATEADNVAECSKRDMGNRVFHKVFGGQQYPPEVIQAWILNKLRMDTEAQIGQTEKVVITVPAYFDEVRRKATQDAGYMAGFEVLDIINEPTAAAVAFGFQQGYLSLNPEESNHETMRILVYDLGGGTFDVTIMEISGNDFAAIATDGDVQLGGFDWDNRLVDLVAEHFIREHFVDPREDEATLGKIWRECEDAKRTLSARSKAAIACDYRGFSSRVEITRTEFEEATHDLLDRTRFTMEQTLKQTDLGWDQIDKVLLVGGSTRMPMVRALVQEVTGKPVDTSVAADEAVAHGAALRAGQIVTMEQGDKEASFTIQNVNSHSLGVVGKDPQTGRRRNGTVIPRNTQLPCKARRIFKTSKANQRSIKVEVVEGESASADDCILVGKCSIPQLPSGLAAGSPVKVNFEYEANGRLKVRVGVPGAKKYAETEIVRENSMPKEHLDGWREFICQKPPTDYC